MMRPRRSTWVASSDHQPGAGIRQHAEMGHVPVVADAVVGAVLAHRRDDDAVRQGQIRQVLWARTKRSASMITSSLREEKTRKQSADGPGGALAVCRSESVDNALGSRKSSRARAGQVFRPTARPASGSCASASGLRRPCRLLARGKAGDLGPLFAHAQDLVHLVAKLRPGCNSAASARYRRVQ